MSETTNDERNRGESAAAQASVGAHRRPIASGFFGSYSHNIDSKGRVIIPQSFRDKMGDRIVVGVNVNLTAIAVYPYDVWVDKVEMYRDLAERNASMDMFLEKFAGYSYDNLSFDGQGRVLLPQALREMYLRDAQNLQVSGAVDYVRIISAEAAREEAEGFQKNAAELLREIKETQSRL